MDCKAAGADFQEWNDVTRWLRRLVGIEVEYILGYPGEDGRGGAVNLWLCRCEMGAGAESRL